MPPSAEAGEVNAFVEAFDTEDEAKAWVIEHEAHTCTSPEGLGALLKRRIKFDLQSGKYQALVFRPVPR